MCLPARGKTVLSNALPQSKTRKSDTEGTQFAGCERISFGESDRFVKAEGKEASKSLQQMATCAVSNYGNVAEAASDSDDEDKLHIVEEDSLPDAGDGDSSPPEDELAHNGAAEHEEVWEEETLVLKPKLGYKVKDECGSDGEEEGSTDAMVEEMLQQGDTAVIYPEAPEDEPRQNTPEASGHDENGTPDAFSQLLTCPYCSRGYKRYTSLKEHIKYRHEKSEDNFSCSLCSYTFAYRTQLDRHMTAHKSGREQRHVTQSGANRKFKCTECAKAFKYKHHLKEHLRIHSGEKPYECSNCKKRFSHSGSYSSHISSKKCIGLLPLNGRPRPVGVAPPCSSPAPTSLPSGPGRVQLREKVDNGRPPQEPQIKAEPTDCEYKPLVVASSINGVFNGPTFQATVAPPQGLVQAVVLPTVGLVSPISINLSDIQNVLKVAVDGSVLRQVLESAQANSSAKEPGVTAAHVPLQPAGHSVISAISLPIVEPDGTTKIIINYNLEPSQVQQVVPMPKEEAPKNPDVCKAEKLPEDLTVKPSQSEKTETEKIGSEAAVAPTGSTCLLCDDCPGGLAALNKLNHCKASAGGSTAEAAEAEGTDARIAALLSDRDPSPGQPPLNNLLSLLKAYFALNAEPTQDELTKISDSVSLPADVVKKWFEKMRLGQESAGGSGPPGPAPEPPPSESHGTETESPGLAERQAEEGKAAACTKPQTTPGEPSDADVEESPPSPLNLSSTGPVIVKSEGDSEGGAQAEPLDLSLPKLSREAAEGAAGSVYHSSVYSVQEEPLNLTCTKKEQPQTDTIYVSPQSANPINIVATQLPTIVAIAEQGSVPCLRALTTSKTILIPQLTYTYTTSGTNPTGTEIQLRTPQPSGNQEERLDNSSDGAPGPEDQNDSDSTPPRKKMRKTENGMYACDLCDKLFQKSSSLLRHKYEHTGKRPHECGVCSKAFKHKHHLIEHTRLHSGEKPYQCDKCGKRFSHSGSYSQHMNHRYSYCKKEAREREGHGESPAEERQTDSRATSPPSQLDSDDRESSTRGDEDSEDEEEEEEEDEEEEHSLSVNDDEIQVVRVGEGEESEEEEQEHVGEGAEEEGEGHLFQGAVLIKEEEETQEVGQAQQEVMAMETEKSMATEDDVMEQEAQEVGQAQQEVMSVETEK
uniref:Zinc finger E-box-binding homeobox 1 n=1 Tax=Paramormyrops kingsleyae TaxID=1676925 RepID=A0A3B3SI98_9TELE